MSCCPFLYMEQLTVINPARSIMPALAALMALIASGVLAQIDSNYSVDPAWMWTCEPLSEEAITVTKPVPGSDIPVHHRY